MLRIPLSPVPFTPSNVDPTSSKRSLLFSKDSLSVYASAAITFTQGPPARKKVTVSCGNRALCSCICCFTRCLTAKEHISVSDGFGASMKPTLVGSQWQESARRCGAPTRTTGRLATCSMLRSGSCGLSRLNRW
ncbi:unnamed protein product [Amoebophrya sp. A120]|nr:unnamed protein product [Amoebophrya sp. A120]|eukprot:GSA120T00015588001.1